MTNAVPPVEPIVATIAETCHLLRLSRTSVHNLLVSNRLKSTKIGSRRLVLRSSINDLIGRAA